MTALPCMQVVGEFVQLPKEARPMPMVEYTGDGGVSSLDRFAGPSIYMQAYFSLYISRIGRNACSSSCGHGT